MLCHNIAELTIKNCSSRLFLQDFLVKRIIPQGAAAGLVAKPLIAGILRGLQVSGTRFAKDMLQLWRFAPEGIGAWNSFEPIRFTSKGTGTEKNIVMKRRTS
jgi:hypothetical protein